MRQQPLFQQPITLSCLESHLWEAANILRGSPVDRTDWKSYILPLLFFKRICDVWDEEYQEAVETYGQDFDDEHRFQVLLKGHRPAMREAVRESLVEIFGGHRWPKVAVDVDPLSVM